MPIYEYECDNCLHRFELKQNFGDRPEANCPQCKSNAKRIFSPVPIIFKGSGFYVTENRSDNKSRLGNKQDGGKPTDTENKKESPKEHKETVAS
ncbi:FmdB family zinc ribbon protein [Candidatus Omnitrophota bacterium]